MISLGGFKWKSGLSIQKKTWWKVVLLLPVTPNVITL